MTPKSERSCSTVIPKGYRPKALAADGRVREHADVVEITGPLSAATRAVWPPGMQVVVQREHPYPAAQLRLFEERDRWRYQAFATNTTAGQGGSSKPDTGPTPASKTGSASPVTPPASTASTPRG